MGCLSHNPIVATVFDKPRAYQLAPEMSSREARNGRLVR